MAQIGPNDIEAKFVLTDEMSAKVKTIEKNLTTATTNMAKGGEKTSKVFDKWNFSLQGLKVGFNILTAAMKGNQEVAEEWASAQEGLFSNLRGVMNGLIDAVGGRGKAKSIADSLGLGSLLDQLSEAEKAHKKLVKTFDEDNMRTALRMDGEAITEGSLKVTRALIAAAEDRVKVLETAAKLASPNGPFGFNAVQAVKMAEAFEKGKKETMATVASVAKYRNEMTDIIDLEEARVEFEKRVTEELKKQQEQLAEFDFGTGFQTAANDMEAEFTHMGNVGKRFAQETRATISNDLFSALKREEISFADFTTHIFDGILKQITDMISAQAIGGIASLFDGGGGGGFSLSSLFGGSGGVGASSIGSTYGDFSGATDFGNITGAGTLPSFAGGGVAEGPSTGYLAVLHGRERVTPENGAGSGGGVVVNLNLTAMDGRSAISYLRTREAQQAIGDAVTSAMKNRADVRGAVYDG